MQDYIPRGIDINGTIDTIECRQFDNNSRFLRVKLRDDDLAEDNNTFDLSDCSTALYIRPESGGDVSFISGTVESPSGVVTFLIPGSVTQTVGIYMCQIRIYEGDDTDRPVISSKPFKLTVDESIADDSAIEATPEYSALTMAMTNYQAVKNQMAALVASPAGSGGDVGTEVRDARVGWNGTEYESLGVAIRTQMENTFNGSARYIDAPRFSEEFSGNFNNFPNNRMYPIDIDLVTATAAGAANAPDTVIRGTLLTFGRKATRYNLDVQMFVTQSREKLYVRVYDGENPSANTPGTWSDWTVVGGSSLPQYRAGVNDAYADYNHLISNVTDDGTFHVSQTASSGGATVQRWNDLPDSENNFIVTNARYSTNWILQTATATSTYTDIYRRIIPRAGVTGSPSNWVKLGYLDPRLKVLAVGDSICAGRRNGGKGFVGDLGLPADNVKNKGVSGTTLSNSAVTRDLGKYCYRALNQSTHQYEYCYSATALTGNDLIYDAENNIKWSEYTPIPDKLILVKTKELPNFLPDIIIANGGHNDYGQSVQLGDIPDQPATDINTLNAGTVMGGLQRLFLTMINHYPTSERFFVTTHKINRTAQNEPEKNGYLPTKRNGQGYTETDLHDAIIQCCSVYNVRVIDVFNDSPINSLFEVYRGDQHYADVATASTDLTHYFDSDGVHPLERGYVEGYVPLIREAIRTGTVKN